MKQLYESILKSVGACKEAVIHAWCEKHLRGNVRISIKDERIYTDDTVEFIDIKNKEDFPEYIKFGKCGLFVANNCCRYMTNEQYPLYAKTMQLEDTAKNLDFVKNNFLVVKWNSLNLLKGVTKIKRIFWSSDYDDISLICSKSEFPLNDFKNIHLVNTYGGIVTVNLNYSKAEKQFCDDIFAIDGKYGSEEDKAEHTTKYIKETFPNIDGLSRVYFCKSDGKSWEQYKVMHYDKYKGMKDIFRLQLI